ncbi:glycine betaine/L-proline ABC transporter ATP-binding protein, partial [Pseudomonas syringae pv. tagetis]
MSRVDPNMIVVNNVFKFFGSLAKEALALIMQNQSKVLVLAQPGCVVGDNDRSLSNASRQIMVIMRMYWTG